MEAIAKILERLIALHERSRLPSTLLFAGPEYSGKQETAQKLARVLLSIEDSFPLENHPDFNEIDCTDKDVAGTQGIRDLLSSLHLQNFSAPKRVVVLRDCDALHVQASNALLKSLEEPPARVQFILTSAHRQRLLQTVISRCQLWYFSELTGEPSHHEEGEDIATLLEQLTPKNSASIFAFLEERKGLRDKQALGEFLQIAIAQVRKQLLSEACPHRARLLENLIFAEPLLLERNLNPGNVLWPVFRAYAERRELDADKIASWIE